MGDSSAPCLSTLPGILSGPVALWGLISFSSFRTPLVLTLMDGSLGVWLGPRSERHDVSSLVKTEQNWSPMLLRLVVTIPESEAIFLQGNNTSVILLSGLDQVPETLGLELSFINMPFTYWSCCLWQDFELLSSGLYISSNL